MQHIYLIGAGVIGRHHAKATCALFESDPEAFALHICDRDPTAIQSFREAFPAAQAWTDAAEMLAAPALPNDVVVVATPPSSHHSLTVAALRSGRHVLCEKPLAMDAAEARAMLAAARDANRLLGCCSVRSIGDEREKLRDLLAGTAGLYSGAWINLRSRGRSGVECQPKTLWFTQKKHSGGGCLMDWGPYDFTSLAYLLDPQEVVIEQAWVRAPQIAANLPDGLAADVETHVGATLLYRLRGGREVVLQYERASACHGEDFQRQMFFADGVGIQLHHTGATGAKLFHDHGGRAEVGEFPDLRNERGRLHARPLAYFLRRITSGDGPAVVQEQAVFNYLVIQGIYRAAQSAGAVRVIKSPDPRLEDIRGNQPAATTSERV